MATRPIYLLAVLVAVLFPQRTRAAEPAAGADNALITRQLRDYALGEITDRGDRLLDAVELPKTPVDQAMKFLATLRDDGAWPDIDYKSDTRSAWQPYDHLTRVLSITVHARRKTTPADESTRCLAGVHRALTFWAAHDFQCPNWWYNQIGVPKITGDIAILVGDDLTAKERTYIADTVMSRSEVGAMTGQNRVWLAGVGVMRGLLKDDNALVRKAAGVIRSEVWVSTGEGIQPDWSYHQHGPQQQFGNYGMAYAVEMSRWATVLRGSAAAFTDSEVAILRNFLLNGEAWTVWRGTMDVSACGRQIFPGSPGAKGGVIAGVSRAMAVADPSNVAEYRAFLMRNTTTRPADDKPNDLVGDRAFWRSDYLVHRGPTLGVTVKMCSARVIGGESINSENLQGAGLADGVTLIYRTGHEYDDIFPVWDWLALPGTTEMPGQVPIHWPSKEEQAKLPRFVGGVADGSGMVGAFDFRRDALTAKKAWFFRGDVTVCLGADISNPSLTGPTSSYRTTINQCLRRGPVTIERNGKREPFQTKLPFNDADAIEHDGIRYLFPVHQRLLLDTTELRGNWKTVFDTPATPRADVKREMFTLTIDNIAIDNDPRPYMYAVVPVRHASDPQIRQLSNTPQLQAVTIGKQWGGVVFWSAGEATIDGAKVAVDQPCVLIVDSSDTPRRVMLADPTHDLKSLKLIVDGTTQTIKLPTGGDAGGPVSVTVVAPR